MSGAPPAEWVVATGNPGKLVEIREILGALRVALRPLADFPPPLDLPEEGDDYAANAAMKARAAALHTGRPALGDDSGLEVDALGGRPGPRSARYGGPGLDDAGRVRRLLEELEGVAPGERRARFVCVAAWASPAGRVETARGVCEGRILAAPRGAGGFGYDPIFQPEGEDRSLAELPPAHKNRISHRARALLALREALAPGP